jgi:hypothetical protein
VIEMLYKTLGVVQIICLSVIGLNIVFGFFEGAVLFAVAYFIFKGIIFGLTRHPLSYLDAVFGFYFLFVVFGIFSSIIVSIVAMLFLGQKTITYLFR